MTCTQKILNCTHKGVLKAVAKTNQDIEMARSFIQYVLLEITPPSLRILPRPASLGLLV